MAKRPSGRGAGILKQNINFGPIKTKTMKEIFGTEDMSAGEIMKAVWRAIKKYDLRDA